MASGALRLRMLEAAIAGQPGFVVDDCELRREGPSYTVDTLRDLWAMRVDAGESSELALVLSAEAFVELPTWHDPVGVLTQPDSLHWFDGTGRRC